MSVQDRAYPLRGEIWWMQFPGDALGKRRPGIIVSLDARNSHPRSDTVLAIPLSTSIHKAGPFHLLLRAGETGLHNDSVAWAENITTITRGQLAGPVDGHRPVTSTQICRLAGMVKIAMGCAEL